MYKLLLIFSIFCLTCLAAPPAVEQQADNLRTLLHQADEAYYNQGTSLMSDAAYDALREQYDRLISRYPELTNAPSIGATPADASRRIPHTAPVLSLQKATTDAAVDSFIEKCGRDLLYCVEPKIDGLTVVLRYRNGLLTQALTRGDGKSGTDITTAVLASGAVPVVLTNAPSLLDVRGEAFLPLAAFGALNQRRAQAGESALKSPRNTASGTLQLDNVSEIAARGLRIQIFDLLATEPMPATHTEALALIRRTGLPVVESHTVSGKQTMAVANELLHQPALYQTDGVVIKVDDRAIFEALGATAHHPRGAIARKIKETPVETRLLRIEWTDKQTPIAHFEPVELHGATIQKATLHNLDRLRAMDLMLGDVLLVIRAGGSVPEIIGRSPGKRTGNERPIPDPPNVQID